MIPNLLQVEDSIWRGGQPETPEDWEYLANIGVNQIIKLNTDSEGVDSPVEGTALFKCPITTLEQILTEPDKQAVIDAVGFISPGSMVHCEHGQDRTGLVVACYRRSRGWSKAKAEEEMLNLGFHKLLLGLWEFWREWTP